MNQSSAKTYRMYIGMYCGFCESFQNGMVWYIICNGKHRKSGQNLGRSKTLGNSALVVTIVAEHTTNFLRMKDLMVVELLAAQTDPN